MPLLTGALRDTQPRCQQAEKEQIPVVSSVAAVIE